MELWDFIAGHLEAARAVALLVVVESTGSAPGKVGFKMAVAEDGSLFGTIGGGLMEFNLVERVRSALASGTPLSELLEQVHHRRAPPELQSGMICAGSQRIALHSLRPHERPAIEALRSRPQPSGTLQLGPSGLALLSEPPRQPGLLLEPHGHWLYQERTGPPHLVCILGGGHVGLALSRTLELLDFELRLFDHRADVATLHQVRCPKIITPFEQLGPLLPEGDHVFAVIVTTGFATDAEALFQLSLKRLRYVGLMGSKAKIKHIFDHVRARGVPESFLQSVRAPIGIPIRNHTPAEIAISIAAELIHVRNGGSPGSA